MNSFRKIPSVDEILRQRQIEPLIELYNRRLVVETIRKAIDELRKELSTTAEEVEKDQLLERIMEKVRKMVSQATSGTLRKVINGTGVVLHTNLGRAPLGQRAMQYMNDMAVNYNNLEMNLEKGERGSRYWHVEELLIQLTGAEAALIVNNNAAAVLLGLTTMAKDREVIVSRGQLVEIGGGFRVPEVMKLSGAKLVEVGTTNRTYIADFSKAITAETALLFSAHTSNYKIVGFSEEVKLEDLVKLGKETGIPVMQDLGSGILYKLEEWGLEEEPTVQECVATGADIITFSGDKLLGGPQAGLILGKKEYIQKMKKNQLLRALRVDKLTIAALEGTLIEYLAGKPEQGIPVIHMLTCSRDKLKGKAERLYNLLSSRMSFLKKIDDIVEVEVEDMVGGGAYPTYKIPGYGIEIKFKGIQLETVAKRLRLTNPALLTRRQEDKMLISVRTLLQGDEEKIADLLVQVLEE